MEERIIIESQQYDFKKARNIMFGISAGLIVIGLLLYILNIGNCRYSLIGSKYYYKSLITTMLFFWGYFNGLLIDLGIVLSIVSTIIVWWLGSYKLTVTDKRIYGQTSFGKRVDLPVDSISAVASSVLKGIAVATSSGRIVFMLIQNRDEIHSKISQLIIDRQRIATQPAPTIKQEIPQSSADELKKYKDLLDSGVITKEEFDAKKKQLLGL